MLLLLVLAQRRTCPAARVQQSHGLAHLVRRQADESRNTLNDGRRRRGVASFGYAFKSSHIFFLLELT